MKKDCRVKENINALDMSEELKEQISKVLLTSSEDESDSSQEDEIFYTNDENNMPMCEGSENCDCTECIFQINVIKAETKLALETK